MAVLRDGTELHVGEEVTTDIYSKCVGQVFVVEEINPYEYCESGTMIIVHLKSDPERKMLGFKKEGWVKPGPDGIDANWFKKHVDDK